jgi:hypothetical protein
MLPAALSGELGSELTYLSVQPAPACTTGGFSGVDGNSPHGVSSLALSLVRRPLHEEESKAKPFVS